MTESEQGPTPPPQGEPEGPGFRKIIALYMVAPIVTHLMFTVVLLRNHLELDTLGLALTLGSIVTAAVLLLTGLLAFRS